MKKQILIALFVLSVTPVFAELTAEQKVADFRVMASLYSKRYAPLEWKRTSANFDALNLQPWLDRVRASQSDLDYYDICVEYIAGLQDSHVQYALPSDFIASLGFTVDIYDGKVLIDSINRTRLPAARYPFGVGDELVSVDGTPVDELMRQLAKYTPLGNPRATMRRAAARIVIRSQQRNPYAARLGDSADVLIRRASGAEERYTIAWFKTGTPVEAGPVPFPKAAVARAAEDGMDYRKFWEELQHSGTVEPHGELGTGGRTPIYNPPAGFVQRLGRTPADFFFSGTYMAGGRRIGLIRIPSYGTLAPAVIAQFQAEMDYFEQNTDGLVVDQIRNNGGFLCFGEELVLRMTPYAFDPVRYELRVDRTRLVGFWNNLNAALNANAEPWLLELFENIYREAGRAYNENRGLTAPVPLCSVRPQRDPYAEGVVSYTKPLIMLIDEFSISTADSVPAMIQDSGRGLLFGMRTNGAGGTNITVTGPAFSEAALGMTLGLMVRPKMVATAEYPTTRYIENVGVRPDIEYDYMTRENLMTGGRPYVEAFTNAILQHIARSR